MNGDPKVVAALAVAILALPPVVNAIMAKAADQADASWLKDIDFDGTPDIDDPPPLEHTPPPGDRPPPDQPPPDRQPPPRDQPPPPEEPCEPVVQGDSRTLQDGVSRPTGRITLPLEGRQRGVLVDIQGQGVTGSPEFVLDVDGTPVWEHGRQYLRGAVDQQPRTEEQERARAPEVWTLSWDLNGVLYDSFDLTLATVGCEGA